MTFQNERNTEQLSQYSEQTAGWATEEQGSISDRTEDFVLFTMPSPAAGLTQQSSFQWILRTPSSG